jgi:hypothetical protein
MMMIYLFILKYYSINAPKYFGASAPSSGSFDVEFAEVIICFINS